MLSRELPDKAKQQAMDLQHTARLSDGMLSIDLNCDMGEGMDNDAAIMPFISSANIACGYHAGDEDTMRHVVEEALKHNVAIGAHPSYPDRENFGRVDILDHDDRFSRNHSDRPGTSLEELPDRPGIRPEDLPNIIIDQLGALQKVCTGYGTRLHHVKPHGALYNRAARDAAVSALVCKAIKEFDSSLLLYGGSGSIMEMEAERYGLSFVREVFADRTYREDGSLTPRGEADALIEDSGLAIRQVLKMIREGRVAATSGKEIPLIAETVCIHGDGDHAAEFARMIHEALAQNWISVSAPNLKVL